MKKLTSVIVVLLFASITSYAQVKIGNNPDVINGSSILELESNNKVFVITRVSETQMNNITPLEGALVYNTDEQCVYQYNGTEWNSLCDSNANRTVLFDPVTYDLTIEGMGTVNLGVLKDDADADPNNEIQDLQLTGNILTITNNKAATAIDLSGYLDNTDNQNLTSASIDTNNVLTIAIENGSSASVDLSSIVSNTDAQTISLDAASNVLTLGNGTAADTTADLSVYLDNTDNQNLTSASIDTNNVLTIAIENGDPVTVDLSAYINSDDQNLTSATIDASNILTIAIEDGS
ncbi:hypothetical protein BSU00_11680, partial [Tenacibaculum sp. SG-28]